MSIFFARVWSFAICFTMLPILIRLQRSPSPRPVISCIAPITFPKIRLPSFRPWDITPRRNSPCLLTSGSHTRPRSTKSISNMHATAARNASLIIPSTVTTKKPILHMKSRDVSGTDARDVSSAMAPTGSMVKPCRNFTVPLWKRSSIEYLKRQGYNVVEVWECDVRWELNQNEEMKDYFNHFRIAEPLEPCHALYGGRTNAAKLYHCCQGDENIKYVDFTSLYPRVNHSKTVPTGHPEILTKNFDEDVSNYAKYREIPEQKKFRPNA